MMTFEEWLSGTRGAVGSEIPEYMAKWAWEAAIASVEEDVEHRVNAAWQTGYDAGRGVE